MQLINYYNFIKHHEVETRNQLGYSGQELLYGNFIQYTFLTVYGKKQHNDLLELCFICTNHPEKLPPCRLNAYISGNYYCINDISSLPAIILNRIHKNGAALKGLNHYYLQRVLVSISLDINALEIHHLDRNSLNNRIDNLLPVTREEHDLIHELEKEEDDIIYSPQIAKVGSITTYTKNVIAKCMLEKTLSSEMASEITGKSIKEVNAWQADYKKYGRVGSKTIRSVSNVFKLPDFYIIKMLKHYYIEGLSIEETREELLKSRLLNPKTKKPVTMETIRKYIDGHPYFAEWYNLHNED